MTSGISIIIPVYHESQTIHAALEALNRITGKEEVEIIVVDGHPEGTTIQCLTGMGFKNIIARKGRAAQMNAGAAAARGSILLFLHADTRLPADAAAQIRGILADRHTAAGAFHLGIDSPRRAFRVIEFGANLRSGLTRIPYGDQGIFIRRDVFDRLGGFADMPLMEDIDLMRRLKSNRLKIRFSPSRVRTSSRRWDREGIFYTTLRNWTISSLFYMGVSPKVLKRFYS